jgi:hypothetical protein
MGPRARGGRRETGARAKQCRACAARRGPHRWLWSKREARLQTMLRRKQRTEWRSGLLSSERWSVRGWSKWEVKVHRQRAPATPALTPARCACPA